MVEDNSEFELMNPILNLADATSDPFPGFATLKVGYASYAFAPLKARHGKYIAKNFLYKE